MRECSSYVVYLHASRNVRRYLLFFFLFYPSLLTCFNCRLSLREYLNSYIQTASVYFIPALQVPPRVLKLFISLRWVPCSAKPHRHGRGLVDEDLIDLAHDLGSQLLVDGDGAAVLVDLLGAASAGDGRAHVGVLEHPGQGQHAHLDAQLVGDGLQLVDALDDGVPLVLARALPVALDEVDLLLGEARVVGDAVLVLARQDALLHGREDGQAEADLAVQVGVLLLDARAVQHVVVGLLHDGADQAEPVGVPPRQRDLVRAPLGRAPVLGLARADQVVKGPHRLLHGRVPVRPVRVDEVHVRQLQPLQGCVHGLEDVLPRQAHEVDLVVPVGPAPVDLCIRAMLVRYHPIRRGARAFPHSLPMHISLTLVEMTRSGRFHSNFLMASPMTFSDSPPAYPSAQSKKLTPQSYAAFMQAKVPSGSGGGQCQLSPGSSYAVGMLPRRIVHVGGCRG